MENQIDILRLKEITNLIFDHIVEDLAVKTVSIGPENDYYWEIPDACLFGVTDDQPRLDIGRLSDDLGFLSTVADNKEQAVALMLIHVAPLLRHIGIKIGK